MSKFIDMTGWVMTEHGIPDSKWTIIEKVNPPENIKDKHHTYWLCECSCKNHTRKILDGNSVKSGRTKSCGCSKLTGLYVGDYKELMKEWDWHKNNKNGFNPYAIRSGSNQKVSWICAKQHRWDAAISNRTSGKTTCPYCSGLLPIVGETDLATTHPNLALEWNYEKNKELSPTQVKAGSNKKVWWKCPLGHSYQMIIHHKTNGTGCPICSGHITLTGFNDFATKHPELLSEWDYERNTVFPTEIPQYYNKKVWWKCKCGHNWMASVNNRASGTICPKCATSNRIISFGKTKNTSGVIGVSLYKRINKWKAGIRFNNKDISLGYYFDKDDAIRARLNKEVEMFGYDNAPQRHLFEQYGITQQNDLTEDTKEETNDDSI